MEYDDACDYEVTFKEAKAEIKAHSLEMADFVEEVGSQDTYTGQQVLDWLGY